MKRPNRFWLMSICAVACLLGAEQWFHARPVHAQQSTQPPYNDGTFYISALVDVDSSYNLYLDSYMEVEFDYYEDIDEIEVDAYPDEDGTAISCPDCYADGDDDDPAELSLQSNAPVATGHEYGLESDGYACFDDGEDDCDWEYIGDAYASVNVASPSPQITSLSTYSVNQGDQGTLTITGTNLVESSGDQLTINLASSSAPFTQTGSPTSNTATFAYDFTWYPAGTYALSVTNNEGTSNSETFTVLSGPPPPPPPDPCAVTSNPQAGYSSIVSTGTAGGSGSMAVSFSGAAFAAISPTVTYGPFSTPSSIAANIAANITTNYFQYGLSAKAFGPNVVYSGNAPLGAVSNMATGNGGATPSFTTTTSTEAGTSAQTACQQAPTSPAPNSEVTIVSWIDGNAITLPSGASLALQAVFPPPLPLGLGGPWSVGSAGYFACLAEIAALTGDSLGVASNTAADTAYANAWLLKYSGNQDPGKTITPSTFTSFNFQYRLFADYSPSQGIHTTSIGYTPDPCGTPLVYVQGVAYSQNGHYTGDSNGTSTSLFGDQFLLAETRVGSAGQAGWKTLNNQREIPWVWSVIEFDPNGYPDLGRIQNTPMPLTNPTNPTNPTTNYQIFPTYSVYSDGILLYTVHPGTPAAFAVLPPGMSLPQNLIQ
jgi:hypothetical protein